MPFYRRRLPHLYYPRCPVFLTWRLYDSLPPNRVFPELTSGQAFAIMDRLLDETRTGSFFLRQPEIAQVVVRELHYNATELNHYDLHAWVIMPNHMHVLLTPLVELPKLTRSLKGITAKRANQILGRTGHPFWQEESYDHLVRNDKEFDRIKTYIEFNPVRAGLVAEPKDYEWSSASAATGGSPADQGVRPTSCQNP